MSHPALGIGPLGRVGNRQSKFEEPLSSGNTNLDYLVVPGLDLDKEARSRPDRRAAGT